MPTIKDKLYFNFDGVWSNELGLINVSLDGGMFEETMVSSRDIVETKIRGNNKPLLHSLEEEPIEFEMNIAFENEYTQSKIDQIIRWLFVDYYKPLYFKGSEDRVFYCMPVDDATIVHTGFNKGYFTITMRCDSSNIYSPITSTPLYTVGLEPFIISVPNNGHYEIYPEISILKSGNGNISIENLNDGGSGIFEVRDLVDTEDIYLHCGKEIIQTNIVGLYRYDKLNGHFPRLVTGDNQLRITGNCNISIRYKAKYRF